MIKYISKVFFHDDRRLAIHFMNTENKDLRGVPKDLILEGKAQKVFDYMESREFDQTNIN